MASTRSAQLSHSDHFRRPANPRKAVVMRRTPRHLLTITMLLAVGSVTAACGTTATPASTTTSPTASSSSAPTTAAPPGSTSSTPATAATTTPSTVLPLSTATTNGTFLSPSRNLACLIAQNPSSQVRCASFAPPLLVTMTADGTKTTCTGPSCELGNPATDTAVLPYGSATGDGTFTCESASNGITCTNASGVGFLIAKSGITDVGG